MFPCGRQDFESGDPPGHLLVLHPGRQGFNNSPEQWGRDDGLVGRYSPEQWGRDDGLVRRYSLEQRGCGDGLVRRYSLKQCRYDDGLVGRYQNSGEVMMGWSGEILTRKMGI